MQLGITTIQRDRAPYIKEWIAFHYLVGFRKFYFFANDCKDNTLEILTKLKKHFDITIFMLEPGLDAPQLACYEKSYKDFGGAVDWMAFIDGDEFLFPTSAASLETALYEFSDKKISAIGAYWSVFGSSGFIEDPLGLVIENFRYKAPDNFEANRHIKSILRGGLSFVHADNPHFFKTPLGTYDENLRQITYGWTDYAPTYKKFRVNHYICQSDAYFIHFKKDTRGPDNGDVRDEAWWKEHNRNEVLDNSMNTFITPLKNILNSIG